MQIYNDKELSDFVKKLNALYSDHDGWTFITARKDYQDEFGSKVYRGQIYFKRQYGVAYDDVLKLSRNSMELLIYCLFNGNFTLQHFCEKLIMEENKRLSENFKKFSPVDKLFNDKSNKKRY